MEKKSVVGPWSQGLYEISATATEIVGTLREDFRGNKYHYAKAGATALAPGKNTTAPGLNADWVNETPAAAAIGAKEVTITHVAVGSDVLAEDFFRGGQLHVNDEAGEGHWYTILHSTAATATSTTITFTLEDPGLKVAITASSECTPVPSPYMATVISATITDRPTGVPLVDVTAAYYYWSLTSGDGIYLSDSTTPAVGAGLVFSATDGALGTMAGVATTGTHTTMPIAIASGTAGVNGEYKPCIYQID